MTAHPFRPKVAGGGRSCAECGQPAPRGVLCPPCYRSAQAARPLHLPRPEPEPRPIPFCPCGAVRGVVEIGGRWRCAPCHAAELDDLEDVVSRLMGIGGSNLCDLRPPAPAASRTHTYKGSVRPVPRRADDGR